MCEAARALEGRTVVLLSKEGRARTATLSSPRCYDASVVFEAGGERLRLVLRPVARLRCASASAVVLGDRVLGVGKPLDLAWLERLRPAAESELKRALLETD